MREVVTKMTLSFLDRFRTRRDQPPLPVFDGLAQVRAYWEGLRSEDGLPQRSALDPRGLGGVLDRVFLAERIGRGLVQLRVAGSGLGDFAGMDVRGLPLSCLFAADSRPLLAQCVESVFSGPAAVELDLGSDRLGGETVIARLLLLPLADVSDRKLLLGAISFIAGAVRCKFQIRARREETMPPPAALTVEAPPPKPIRRYGHLALVHSTE
jgi:hypothetical protein